MTCRNVTEKIVENARHEVEPGKLLRDHARGCNACEARLEAEEALTEQLRSLRTAAWNQRSSAASREMLMARFAAQHKVTATPRRYWALAAAAALAIGIFAIPRHQAPAAPVAAEIATEIPVETPADPEAEGFVAVPYVPPLATGEMLRVVRTELNPAALASLGVNVDPSWTAQLPADLLMGEDGVPRAVRVAETTADSGGF